MRDDTDVKPRKSKCRLGRPSLFTQELTDLICQRVATHPIGLTKLCSMYNDMPNPDTVNAWRYKYPEFAEKFRQAKMFQAELLAETLNELCDIPSYVDDYSVERVDSGIVARQRLKVDTIKWQASKLLPKVYGDHKFENLERDQDLSKATLEHARTIEEEHKRDH